MWHCLIVEEKMTKEQLFFENPEQYGIQLLNAKTDEERHEINTAWRNRFSVITQKKQLENQQNNFQ